MREYKFRGKSKKTGEWVYGYFFKDFNGKCYIINTLQRIENANKDNVWVEVLEETVGQYTGLHDKDGKEIYEGDIVKSFFVDTDEAGNEIYKYYIIEVKYDEVLCSYKIDKFMNLEVIGNIYENKELLNETNR